MILMMLRRLRAGAFRGRLGASLVVTIALLSGGAAHGQAKSGDFAHWLAGFKSEALGHGISQATLKLALANLAPIPRVIELDRKQPEFTLTFAEYVARTVPPGRIAKGRQLGTENHELLERVSGTYGVPPRVILALWGMESDYGRITGDFPVIPALATLAYDGRRSSYFRSELLEALRIVQLGYIDLASLRGSWAGAMGQNQFMPSNYLHYAVDFEGKGRRDIWHDRADVFASTANFLLHLGWRSGEGWGQQVSLPEGFDRTLADLATRKSLSDWSRLGVQRVNGEPLPDGALEASIVLPGGEQGPAYLVYDNYRAFLKWNRSTYFATAVGLLADAIGDR